MQGITPMKLTCPRCGQDTVEGYGFTVNGLEARQPMSCPGCGLEWEDVYRLERRLIAEENDE